jgi:hypothetical protein
MVFKSRITKTFNLTSLGRHAFCKAKSRSGNTPDFDLLVEIFRPRLQVNTVSALIPLLLLFECRRHQSMQLLSVEH